METSKFLKLIINRSFAIEISHKPYYLIKRGFNNISHFQLYAELTEHIDFDCTSKDNKCRNTYWGSAKYCCEYCVPKVGYLRFLKPDYHKIQHIARKFNEISGFWREGKGCVLERKYRSPVCLTYYTCDSHSEAEFKLLRILGDGVKGTDISYGDLKRLLTVAGRTV